MGTGSHSFGGTEGHGGTGEDGRGQSQKGLEHQLRSWDFPQTAVGSHGGCMSGEGEVAELKNPSRGRMMYGLRRRDWRQEPKEEAGPGSNEGG